MSTTFRPPHPDPNFYTPGGTLSPEAPSYIPRAADNDLLDALVRREFCYVLTPRQMGKSSLMIRTAEALKKYGYKSVIIDLTAIGAKNLTIEQWYLGQIAEIVNQMHFDFPYEDWWSSHNSLSEVLRFVRFLVDELLEHVPDPIIIFVDEIDTTLSLSFSDDYFAAIRALYNARANHLELSRLNFVLLGVASPSDLIKDVSRTPFNIGTRIELTDFQPEEAAPLAVGLAPDRDAAKQLLKQVLFWTGGHPYLTQTACRRVAKWASEEWSPSEVPVVVDDLIKDLFLSEAGSTTDSNLTFVRDRVVKSKHKMQLLQFYRTIRRGEIVSDTDLDPVAVELKLGGLVKVVNGRILRVRNRVYEFVFDEGWIQNMLKEKPVASSRSGDFRYDVFVSYSHRDSEWVTQVLLPYLEELKFNVAIDVHDFMPGAPIFAEVERVVRQSRRIVLVLSPSYVASEWSNFEYQITQSRDSKSQLRQLIPILLRQCEVPRRLASLTILDVTNPDKTTTALMRLVRALGATSKEPVTPEPQSIQSSRQYNTSVIRKLLRVAFTNEELEFFLFDHFRSVYTATRTSSQDERIQQLLAFVDDHKQYDKLLDSVAQEKPRQYRQYEKDLFKE